MVKWRGRRAWSWLLPSPNYRTSRQLRANDILSMLGRNVVPNPLFPRSLAARVPWWVIFKRKNQFVQGNLSVNVCFQLMFSERQLKEGNDFDHFIYEAGSGHIADFTLVQGFRLLLNLLAALYLGLNFPKWSHFCLCMSLNLSNVKVSPKNYICMETSTAKIVMWLG
ncbi:hypothetical protein TNCV_104291 [Trichonephila clavipes]|nr:hypothetical protein TNCV_104291 [Trichonephila clavipes]